jgi:hypothetical protein
VKLKKAVRRHMVPMHRIAAENRQSETAILVAPTDGAFDLRCPPEVEDALMRPRSSVV